MLCKTTLKSGTISKVSASDSVYQKNDHGLQIFSNLLGTQRTDRTLFMRLSLLTPNHQKHLFLAISFFISIKLQLWLKRLFDYWY